MADEVGFDSEDRARISHTVRYVEGLQKNLPPQLRQSIPGTGPHTDVVRVTSKVTTDGLYPGKWLTYLSEDNSVTLENDIWVDSPGGGTLVPGYYHATRKADGGPDDDTRPVWIVAPRPNYGDFTLGVMTMDAVGRLNSPNPTGSLYLGAMTMSGAGTMTLLSPADTTFVARVDAPFIVSGNWTYPWVKQSMNSTTGAYEDASPEVSGDAVTGPFLYELNNHRVLCPSFVVVRVRGYLSSGDVVYDFDRCCECDADMAGGAQLTLGAMTMTASGIRWNKGSAPLALGAMTMSATGHRWNKATSAMTIGPMTMSAVGHRWNKGTSALTPGALTMSASGYRWPFEGEGDLVFGALTMSAHGNAVSVNTNSADRAQNASTLTITGTGFSTTPGANIVTYNHSATGTVTSSTTTSLLVAFGTPPNTTGALTGSVTTGGATSSSVTVATVVPAPTVTTSTADRAQNASGIIITGTGFSTTPGNNSVAFNLGATGTVTASTATTLTVTFGTQPTSTGTLTVVATSNGGTSGAAATVATVVPASTPTGTSSLTLGAATMSATGSMSATSTYDTSSSHTWTHTTATVECWGVGGAGSIGTLGVSGGGGGGGGYAKSSLSGLTVGGSATITINSTSSKLVDGTTKAEAGAGSIGPSGPGGGGLTGDVKKTGGAGGAGQFGAQGGGGGGSAGDTTNGGDGTSGAGGGAGGAAGTTNGAAGGAGGNGAGNGTAGSAPGGGGGGGGSSGTGGAGGTGRVKITQP